MDPVEEDPVSMRGDAVSTMIRSCRAPTLRVMSRHQLVVQRQVRRHPKLDEAFV